MDLNAVIFVVTCGGIGAVSTALYRRISERNARRTWAAYFRYLRGIKA